MPLPSATFDCEVLTPTFLAGARPNGPPELRGPSVRGALRYWYRALLGGRGISETDRLREEEAKVFGSTDRASPVRVQILPYGVAGEKWDVASEIDSLDESNTGTRYLWYFVHPTLTEKDKYDPSEDRRYIVSGARFEVKLSARPDHEEALEEAAQAFWLLAHLGGLGTRSRRMAGAIDANLVESPEGLDLPSFEPPRGYDDWFTEQLEEMGAGTGTDAPSDRPSFSSLNARYADVRRLGIQKTGWDDLVEFVGSRFKNHREDLDVPDKVGLGLPMVTPDGTDDIEVTQNGSPVERRASPLWLQVVRGPDERLDAVATFMESRFAEARDRIFVSWEGNHQSVDDPYRKLGTFVRDSAFNPVSLLPSRQ